MKYSVMFAFNISKCNHHVFLNNIGSSLNTDSIGTSFANDVVNDVVKQIEEHFSEKDILSMLEMYPSEKAIEVASLCSVYYNKAEDAPEGNIEVKDAGNMMLSTISQILFKRIQEKVIQPQLE